MIPQNVSNGLCKYIIQPNDSVALHPPAFDAIKIKSSFQGDLSSAGTARLSDRLKATQEPVVSGKLPGDKHTYSHFCR